MRRLPGVRFTTPDPPPDAASVLDHVRERPGLYVHIPFCRSLCPFCPYNKVRYHAGLAADYATALRWELDTYLAAGAEPFTSLYVGGGTPTLCPELVESVSQRVTVTGERAIEVLPSHLTHPMVARLLAAGFEAVSLGVQSFDPEVLRHLGRPTTASQNRDAVVRAVGRFRCVDVDLLFDTAFDRPEVLLADLATCFELGADQVSTYPLMRFGYTPFGKRAHQPGLEHRLLREAGDLAIGHGYERRSVWTFNRRGGPTYSSITRPTYLGVGAGAATSAGTWFLVDHFGLAPYLAAVGAGRLPIARLAQLSPTAAGAYRLFWQLYTGTVPTGFVARGPGGVRLLTAALDLGRAAGWVAPSPDGLHLTANGYDRYHDVERAVTYHLIEPLWAELMAEHGAAEGIVASDGGPAARDRRDARVGVRRRQ
jgi:menaquinone C8-methyltransferase